MTIAIFVMEVGIDNRIPTYSGGLGVLAGDLAYSFADLGLPATFVTLLSRNGYTSQSLDPEVGQVDGPQEWDWRSILVRNGVTAKLDIAGKTQTVGAFEYKVRAKSETSVLFLDTDFPGNDAVVREASDTLYGGEPAHRLVQEMVLGVGGYRILRELETPVEVYHLNESHAAFAAIELLKDAGSLGAARKKCVFTTHTPIPAGNDVFPLQSVQEAFRGYDWVDWEKESTDGSVNMSRLAAKYSGVTNAVSLKHRFVSQGVIGRDGLAYVTNGVYHKRWVHDRIKEVYDAHLPGWSESPSLLSRAKAIPSAALSAARASLKKELTAEVHKRTGLKFDEGTLTIVAAKRITAYKRNGMILNDPARLQKIASEGGGVQIVIAGKAHPRDGLAKGMLADILRKASTLNGEDKKVRVAVLDNYDMDLAKLLVAGADVWLNNPKRPLEACGTSGMKAAMNGALNLSVYDGWWLEGGVEGENGWGIGSRPTWEDPSESQDSEDQNDLYAKLEQSVLPTYYGNPDKWSDMSRSSIATVGPLFNSYRMVEDYVSRVYSRARLSD